MSDSGSNVLKPTSENLLLIAARNPIPGQTKTRLGASIGMERAAALYRAFLEDLSSRFTPECGAPQPFDFGWAHTPESAPFDLVMNDIQRQRSNADVRFVCQDGNGWGERQANLLRWGADQGYRRTVLTASDSPQMSRSMIDQAFATLEVCDVVVGRVHDGGYYLIGVRGRPDVLSGVPMSTASAADGVVARALGMGLRVGRVESTFDVDVEDDLELLVAQLREDSAAAPATARALVALGLVSEPIAERRNGST